MKSSESEAAKQRSKAGKQREGANLRFARERGARATGRRKRHAENEVDKGEREGEKQMAKEVETSRGWMIAL